MKILMAVVLEGVLTFTACCVAKNTEKIVVASEQVNCVGVARQKCLLIKRKGTKNWELWYSGIEGFEHTPGYEYVLEVRKETDPSPAADRSSIRLILVREISRTEKVSENMPMMIGDQRELEKEKKMETVE